MYRASWFLVLLVCVFLGMAVDVNAQERRRDSCRRNDRVSIEDLDMSPDPIVRGQRVRAWRVKLYFEGSRDCETEIEIRDSDNYVVARESRVDLRRGINEINIHPDERYEFRGKEHCMKVILNLEGSGKDVDAKRGFCARQKPAWSMREDGER